MKVELVGISKRLGDVDVLKGVNLLVESGDFCAIMGPSGCGKSTLLRIIAGLETADRGKVLFDGTDVRHTSPQERRIGFAFQGHALYPHMTARRNIAYNLAIAKLGKSEIKQRVGQVAEMLDISPLLDRLPHQLSGGQRQRVAIGRALARAPQVMLLDEPFSSLDANLRSKLRRDIAGIHAATGTTVIIVTHDGADTEAASMIVRLSAEPAVE